ncbi:carbon-nitrogen hydrolase family protein [Porticoccaceae bacterium]|nr:carbon-nitrogen hydrolase family protein [Porticoccaceae bacterium]
MKLTVAAIQLKPEKTIDANLRSAEGFLKDCADAGVQLAVLPENFAHYGQTDFLQIGRDESDDQGPVRRFLSLQAARHRMWLVAGTIPVAGLNPRPYSRSLLFNPLGEEVDHYDKIHLFDVDVAAQGQQAAYRESDDFSPGKRVAAVDTDFGRLGLTVCYDLRFAELYQQLAQADAHIIAVPAAFTAATGQHHWEVLLRARAIENQVFMIGANLVDRANSKRGLWGGSMIVDPWGTVLASFEDEVGSVIAELDTAMIGSVRAKMPVDKHRRL